MGALTDHSENLLLSWLFTTGTATRPTTWFVALHTADPGEDTPIASELLVAVDADYVRKAVTIGAPSLGQSLSETAASWSVNSGSRGYTITHASIWDAATDGNCLIAGELVVPRVMIADGVLTFNIGEIVAIID